MHHESDSYLMNQIFDLELHAQQKTFKVLRYSEFTLSFRLCCMAQACRLKLDRPEPSSPKTGPLPKGMEDYARCDSHFLIPIYAQF